MPGLFIKQHALALKPYAQVSVLQIVGEERSDGQQIEFVYSEEEGIQTLRVYYRKTKGLLGKLLDSFYYFYGSIKGYSQLVSRCGSPDIHHVHVLTRSGFLPYLFNLLDSKPYVVSEHWSRYLPQNRSKFKGVLRKWLTARIVKNAYAICPVNENLGNSMQEMGFHNPRYFVINNVVNLSNFQPSAELISGNRLLHVSCFDENAKNVKGLLRGFKEAIQHNPSLFLTLVGAGGEWEETKAYAQELNLSPYVEFTGMKSGADLVREFQQSGALVMFSHYENQPVVILEALACGLPVIATRVGSIPDLLSEQRGILVSPGDEKSLTQAMLQVDKLIAPDLKLARREYIESAFGYDGVGQKLLNLYKEALA